MARISIIIPVYNTSLYLRECMDSITHQTFGDIEMICVNDGSIDDSLSILEEYANNDGRVVVITQENGGLSAARNTGLRHASGEFIVFVDSDDILEPKACETFITNIGDSDIIVSGILLFGDTNLKRNINERFYYKIPHGTFVVNDDIRLKTYVSAWGKMYRKSIIDNNNISFPEGLCYEDYSFHWQYLSVADTITFCKDKCYRYRHRSDSIIEKTLREGDKAIDHIEIFSHVMSFVSGKKVLNDNTICSIFEYCFTFAYSHINTSNRKQLIMRSKELLNKYNLHGMRCIDILSSCDDVEMIIRKIDEPKFIYYLGNMEILKRMIEIEGPIALMKKTFWTIINKVI